MRHFVIVFLIYFIFLASPLTFGALQSLRSIQAGTFAPGVSVGFKNAGSVSVRYWFTKEISVDANFEILDRPFTVFYTDIYYYFPELLSRAPGHLRESLFYVGGGIGAGLWNRDENCVRFDCTWQEGHRGSGDGYFLRSILGLEWLVPNKISGIFTELAPSYLLYPNTKIIYDFLFGIRFYL